MPKFERSPLTGSMWVPEMKTHPNAPDFGGRIKVPACAAEMEYIISVWDNRNRKKSSNSPDYGIKLEDPAERGKVSNGGTEVLRSGQNSSYVPGEDSRAKEGDDYNW